MKCSACGCEDHKVLRTDEHDDRIARTRKCLGCGRQFKTAELPIEVVTRTDEILDAFRQVGRLVGEA